MRIEQLKLTNFRNYEKETITFHPKITFISGLNGQGKTNLLESIVYLSLTRSHRINEEKQLIKKGEDYARIECIYEDERKHKMQVTILPKGKTLLLDEIPIQRSSEFIGKINAVIFAPDDLSIFLDSPRERRKIFNQEITKISKTYLVALNNYQKLLKERNAYLKRREIDDLYLDTLDEQMIKEMKPILQERRKFIQGINQTMSDIYKELANSQDTVYVKYMSCVDKEENLEKFVKQTREKDKETHVTNFGVHREDIIFCINNHNVINYASQGQKRMCLLAFKMALLRYIKQTTNSQAIFLLDDVLSELDKQRQKKLIEMVQKDNQCIITTTEIPDNLSITDYLEYEITQAKIVKKG